MEEERWYVYVLQSEKDGTYYTGIAKDVHRCLKQHNKGKGVRRTRGRGPWRLAAYQYAGGSRSSALWWEAHLKRDYNKSDRLEWIEQNKPKEGT